MQVEVVSERIENMEKVTRSLESLTLDPVSRDILASIATRGVANPKDICKELGLERKTFNSLVHKLVLNGRVTRIEGENGTNPRYQVRVEGAPAKRLETTEDPNNRKVVDPEDVKKAFDGEELRARDLARKILGNDKKSSITSLNSVLAKMILNGDVEKFTVEDDEPHYRLVA